jgi:hypothetical protein
MSSSTFSVMASRRPVGVVRVGLTAAACRLCGVTRFEDELTGLQDAARWLRSHLREVHELGGELHVQPEPRKGLAWRFRVGELEAALRSSPASGARDLARTPGGGDRPYRERRRSA